MRATQGLIQVCRPAAHDHTSQLQHLHFHWKALQVQSNARGQGLSGQGDSAFEICMPRLAVAGIAALQSAFNADLLLETRPSASHCAC